MSVAATMTSAARIPRRRHRSLRTPPHRRVEGRRDRSRACRRYRHHLGRGWRGHHRRVHDDRCDRSRRPPHTGLSRHRRHRTWASHAADPPSGDARRQSRAAFALLVFSQSAYRLPEEGRQRLPGTIRQSSLQRRIRSRPLCRAASLLDGRRPARLWRDHHHRSPQGTFGRRSPRRRQQRPRRSSAATGRSDPQHRAAGPACRRARTATSARSAARMRNGRWSNSAFAPSSPTANSHSSASPPAASRRCRCA